MIPVSVAVEGTSDVAIVTRILALARCSVATVYEQNGKHNIDSRIAGYNNAARFAPWFVLRDLDSDAACAPNLARIVLPEPATWMRFRIAVREAESWLLADPDALSRYLRVRAALIPRNPEALPDPKLSLVNLARHSRSAVIRQDMVPDQGVSAVVGPGYVARVLILGVISSLCGFIAFLAGRYLNASKIARMVVLQNKFKKYGDLFLKYGWVIIILAATTPLPFAMVSFIAGYFKFSPATFLKIIVPVRIVRFFISGYLIKHSISLI